MKELSIFIDESGDFGAYNYHSPWYIVTMVFHDQRKSIQEPLEHLEKELLLLGLENHCIHTGPIIRKEEDYSAMNYLERRKIFNICTFELLKLKIENNSFSKPERIFFGSVNDLKRNYLKIVKRQEIDYHP